MCSAISNESRLKMGRVGARMPLVVLLFIGLPPVVLVYSTITQQGAKEDAPAISIPQSRRDSVRIL
jgi:hypothetical protein